MRNEIEGAFDQRLPMRKLGIFPHKGSLKQREFSLCGFDVLILDYPKSELTTCIRHHLNFNVVGGHVIDKACAARGLLKVVSKCIGP